MHDLIVLIISIFGLFLLASCICLPWINRSKINALRKELDELKAQLQPKTIYEEYTPIIQPTSTVTPKDATYEDFNFDTNYQSETKPEIKSKPIGFEQQFGARLPVWIGGIALALAGFFMVKYSIESGLLSPDVRTILGIIFGIGLLYAGNKIRNKENFANGNRIAQALSGAGIADLYVCIFAATSLYNLVPDFIGFIGMALVTATAVVLSIKHGMPIALLGLVGGFLTPALIGAQNAQTPILYIYLYLVLTGLMFTIRKQNWWVMAVPMVIGAFAWVCYSMSNHINTSDNIYLALFLMAISATTVYLSKERYQEEGVNIDDIIEQPFNSASALNYLTIGGSTLLIGIITAKSDFAYLEWSLFGLISLGGLALTLFNQRLYRAVPFLSMLISAIMFMGWSTSSDNAFALTIAIFAAIYMVSGYFIQQNSPKPLLGALISVTASIGYYLVAYYELQYTPFMADISLFWGGIALILAAFNIYMLQKIMRELSNNHSQKQPIIAAYAAAASAFISTAILIELPREFLSIAFAAELFAISWINTKINVIHLRKIAGIIAIIFGLLLIPQIILLLQISMYSLVELQLNLQKGIPIVNYPLFQLGVPAAFFVLSSYLLHRQKNDVLVKSLEVSAIALIGVMGYYLNRHAFHVSEEILFVKAGFIERGVTTNILFIYGLACLWIGRNFSRITAIYSGFVLCAIAMFRIVYFDLIIANPLWNSQQVGEIPLFNALFITYALPIIWTWIAVFSLPQIGKQNLIKYGYGFMLLLSFVFISMTVRHLFHGNYLNIGNTTNAEIYTYSAVWLLFGIAQLITGAIYKNKMIRIASLAMMILVVGKVFLYDASELEGLFRVFSFLGLGLSLLGLSWFYTRFIFKKENIKHI